MSKRLALTSVLLSVTVLCGAVLLSTAVLADGEGQGDNLSVVIEASCTMGGSGSDSHTANIPLGTYSGASGSQYENGIGKTTLTTYCNDYNGFAVYAIGYTGNTDGTNTMVGSTSGSTIATKPYESTDTTSNWSMKVTKVTDAEQSYLPQNMAIQDNFDSWHAVPAEYTKVAQYKATSGSSVTDDLLGAKLETTYATYIANSQTPDTYNGQVKYVVVHPYNHVAPGTEEYTSTITLGSNITSITFSSPYTTTETISNSGDTITLYDGVEYTITATVASGYVFSSWTAGTNSTVGSQTTNPTTYTVTGNSTLSATSEEPTPEYTCTKQYRLQNADGTYPANYTSDGTETIEQGSTCTYTKSETNYTTQTDTVTMNNNQTISLDLPRTTYELTINKNNTYVDSVTGAGTHRWGEAVNISATPATGSRFTTWTQTSGTTSTFADATSATTTFTMPTSNATIYADGDILQPPTSCNTPVPNTTYMQDINDTNYNTVMASLTTDAAYYLRDSRDGEPYCVSKLQDGNLWLLDNLRLDLTNPTTLANTTASNTNASATSLNYLKNGGGTTGDQYAITGVTDWINNPTYSYSSPLIATYGDCSPDYPNECANDPLPGKWTKNSIPKDNNVEMKFGLGSGKIGIYYNYCAASAGSYCYGNNNGSYGTSSGNATEDLCPANWRMPTGKTGGEGYNLCNIINNTTCSYETPMTATSTSSLQYKLSIPFSGFYLDYSTQGYNGGFWTSSRISHPSMDTFSVTDSAVIPSSEFYRYHGYSMRCMLDPAPTTETLTVSLDSNVTSVTFSDGTSPDQTVTTNGGTVNLTPNTSYTITATFGSGYEFSSWTAGANATLGSTTANPTTLTVTGTTTLGVTSQQIPSYNVTVTLDSNTTSVGFYNATYGAQNITTSGDTASLRSGVEYIITATFASGYEFASWSTTSGGTLGDAASSATTYTVTSATTLTLTSQRVIPDPISQCTTPVPSVTYMQDITSTNYNTVLNSMTKNQQYYLRDKRDETPYCVSRLDDGSTDGTIWMTQNLRIQGTITAALSNFDGADFNVSEYDLKTDGTSGGACNTTTDTTGGYYHVCSHLPDASDLSTTGKTTEQLGAWYNYASASAGTITGSSNSTTATEDICPANWHLPSYDTNNTAGSVNSIVNASSSTTKTAFTPATGGFYYGKSLASTGFGYWWSSGADGSANRYGPEYSGSSHSLTMSNLNRRFGFYIRCVR